MVKKSLIFILLTYINFSDILTYFTGNTFVKISLAAFACILFLLYVLKNLKEIDFFFFTPIVIILIYLVVWDEMGYFNLFYTILFGWAMSKDVKFTMMVLKVTFFIQFFLVVYETVFDNYVYESVTSGIINENTFTIMSDDKDFDLTGFRPKGLFTGTLVATSFIIYLTMLYRNKLKMLICLFVMALLVNGRLALLVSSVTLFLNLLVSYDIKFDNKRLPLLLKFQLLFSFFFIFIFLVLFNLPEIVRSNYFNIFNIETDANLGRLISYFQSIDLFLNYSIIDKLFGDPNNTVLDQYGRVTASESGFLSMILDIGIIGLCIYLFSLFIIWQKDKMLFLNNNLKLIGFKYVILVTFISFIQYEHINGNLRGSLFWFMIISYHYSLKGENNTIDKIA
jgi:hypothetical protein